MLTERMPATCSEGRVGMLQYREPVLASLNCSNVQ